MPEMSYCSLYMCSGEGELVQPYSTTYKSHLVLAWFPDYKTARVGGSSLGASVIDARFTTYLPHTAPQCYNSTE